MLDELELLLESLGLPTDSELELEVDTLPTDSELELEDYKGTILEGTTNVPTEEPSSRS